MVIIVLLLYIIIPVSWLLSMTDKNWFCCCTSCTFVVATYLATLHYVALIKILWLLKHSMKIQSQFQVIPKIFFFCFIIPSEKWNKVCFLLRPSENSKAKIILFWFCFIYCCLHSEKIEGLKCLWYTTRTNGFRVPSLIHVNHHWGRYQF